MRWIYEYPTIIFSHLKVSSDWLLLSSIIFKSNMNFVVFFKISLICVSLAALVALEWSLASVRPLVSMQITRSRASIAALVTFERLFFCMLPHYMFFQFTRLNARKLAHCASLWLFTRVPPLVRL